MHPGDGRCESMLRNSATKEIVGVLCCVALLVVPVRATAGENHWTSHGPPGWVYSMVLDPQRPMTVYAGGPTISKSADGGGRWWSAGYGLPPDQPVTAMAIDPEAPDTVYAATGGGGIFKTMDGGNRWWPRNGGLETLTIAGVSVSPSDPSVIYMAANASAGGFPVYRSADGGGSWVGSDNGITSAFGQSMVVDPTSSLTAYLGTNDGIFATADGGLTWRSSGQGLPDPSNVVDLAVDPVDHAIVYASVLNGVNPGGVFKSDDGGATWIPSSEGLNGPSVATLAVSPSDPSTLYAGVSVDGVYKSIDGGNQWLPANGGLPVSPTLILQVHDIVVDRDDPDIAYAGVDRGGGAFKTTDGGGHWFPIRRGLTGACATIGLDPTDPDVVFAGSGDYQGMFKTTDGGLSWRTVNHGIDPAASAFSRIIVDPADPDIVYAAGGGAFTVGGILKSIDRGEHWKPSNAGLTDTNVLWLTMSPVDNSTLYAGTSDGAFVSTDAGGTWSSIGLKGKAVGSFAVNPTDPGVAFAGTTGGIFEEGAIYKTTDGGLTWMRVYRTRLNQGIGVFAIDPLASSTAYVGTFGFGTGQGVIKTTDGGSTWQRVNHGLSDHQSPWIVIDPGDPSTLYAGTMFAGDGGVFVSHDAANHWTSMSQGLTVRNIVGMAIDQTGSKLYVGTCSGGVLDFEIS
jgi:photosystem II stability/assembly factor-like uncharacterized protein